MALLLYLKIETNQFMKRRSFLQATGLAAVGTALTPNTLLASNLPKKKPFTIILGSGFSGLGAAKQLKEAGYDYIILEARKRVGGRVFTYAMDGLTCELGAEWIGKSHTELQKLNDDAKLTMLDHTYETRLFMDEKYSEVGQWGYDESISKFQAALQYMKDNETKALQPLDKIDYWRYLQKIGMSEKNIELRELIDSTDFGETIRNVSAYVALGEYAFSSEKNEMDYWTQGGNTGMINVLAKNAGEDKIKLEHVVTVVSQNKKKMKVTCSNGATFEGDRIICCLPTFAMSKIKWEPGFASSKKDALDQLQYCRIVKTSMLFSERFWKDESFDMMTDTLGHYFFHSSKLQENKKGILTSYAIGDKAYVLSKMPKEKKMKELAHCLQPIFGDIKPMMNDLISYYWGGDTHTQGAYAIYDTAQWFGHREELIERSGNIFFAGEHLAEWQGFMEGAYISGMDAAKAVMKS